MSVAIAQPDWLLWKFVLKQILSALGNLDTNTNGQEKKT